MHRYDPEKHHRRSIRLKNYDYSKNGMYFITIVAQDRLHIFGKIENETMVLNALGEIANQCWLDIPQHYPKVVLHEFVIMPNHVHGIIEINNDMDIQNIVGVGVQNIETQPRRNEFQKIISGSIGAIVRGFKIGVTKYYNETQINANEQIQNIENEIEERVQYIEPYHKQIENIEQIHNMKNDKERIHNMENDKERIHNMENDKERIHNMENDKVRVQYIEPRQQIQKKRKSPIWQRNYYESIIHNHESYNKITHYIINNPKNWKKDEIN